MSEDRQDNKLEHMTFFDAWVLWDKVTPFDLAATVPPVGFARKTSSPRSELSLAILDFIIFLQQRGEETGTNTLAAQGEEAMLWKGTARGATIFTSTEKDRQVMLPNVLNTREFKLHQLKDAQQIKGYIRQPLSQLQKMRDDLKKRETETTLQLHDPLRKAIFALGRAQLLSKSTKVAVNHAGQIPQQFQKFSDKTRTPSELRELLFQIIDDFGRNIADVALFI